MAKAGIGVDSVQGILANAKYICTENPNLKGYLMGAGHGFNSLDLPYYDCSGFVLTCINMATGNINGCTYTGDMHRLAKIPGWEYHSFESLGQYGLKAGDVLVWNQGTGAGANGHTEIVYTDHGTQLAGAHSTATGVNIKAWSNRSPAKQWQDVYRYKSGIVPVRWVNG